MDKKIKNLVAQYEDYQRLQKVFSLDFLIECLTNSRRGIGRGIGMARWSGALLKQYRSNPTLYFNGIHYHELVEFEELRKRGESDEQLGENHAQNPHQEPAHIVAKRKELLFYQFIAKEIIGKKPPFISWPFSHLAAVVDFAIHESSFSYEMMYKGLKKNKPELYGQQFSIEDIKDGIVLLRMGGNICSGETTALTYAKDYLSGKKPAPRIKPSMMM